MVARGDAAPAPRRRSLRSQMTVVVAAFIVSALVSGVVALHALQQVNGAAANARSVQAAGDYRSARLLIIVSGLLGLLVACGLAILLTRRMLRTIARVVGVMTGSDPDLRVGDTGDRTELGAMGEALDRMLDAGITQNEALEAGRTAREAQLHAASARQRLGEREVRHRAQSAVEETNASVLSELRDVLEQAETVRDAAGEIERRAADAEETTRSVVAGAAEAERVVIAVTESLQRVEGITGMIAGVAAQTNLLALNATIEATRAGAAGKGFAVVAGEVKQLAASTRSSTAEITKTVGALRADAAAMSNSITAMSQGVYSINTATGRVTEVATSQRSAVQRLDQCVNDAVHRIQTSQLSEPLERRHNERVGTTGNVVLRFGGTTAQARLHDLSQSGLMCEVTDGPSPSSDVRVEVTLNLGDRQHTVQSVVRRQIATEDAGRRVGLEFTDVPAAAAQAISTFLTELLGE